MLAVVWRSMAVGQIFFGLGDGGQGIFESLAHVRKSKGSPLMNTSGRCLRSYDLGDLLMSNQAKKQRLMTEARGHLQRAVTRMKATDRSMLTPCELAVHKTVADEMVRILKLYDASPAQFEAEVRRKQAERQ